MKIPIIFISYSRQDETLALSLQSHLDMRLGEGSAIVAPRETSDATNIPEHIAKLIESSHFFIMLAPGKPEDIVPFVQQEVGYAYSIARKGMLSIVVLYNDSDSLEGFISKGTSHLAGAFDMSKKPQEETWEEVSTFILDKRIFPLRINAIQTDTYESIINDKYGSENILEQTFRFHLLIENLSQEVIEDTTLDFISPRPTSDTRLKAELKHLRTDILPLSLQDDQQSTFYHPLIVVREVPHIQAPVYRSIVPVSTISQGVPSPISKRIEKKEKELPPLFRRTFFLNRIPPMSMVELPFVLHLYIKQEGTREADFVVYLQVPRFGYDLYQLRVRPGNNDLDIVSALPKGEVRIRNLAPP